MAAGPARLVDQAVRGHDQVIPQLGIVPWIEFQLVQGRAHVPEPRIALGRADDGNGRAASAAGDDRAAREYSAGPPQYWMRNSRRCSSAGPRSRLGIDGPQFRISRDLGVEAVYQAAEGRFAADGLVQARALASRS